jgi:hypothetical protein
MSVETYLSHRSFQSPYLKAREDVGPASILWALLFGPAYYWRKRAPVEGLIYFLLTVPMVGLADIAEAAGLPDGIDIGLALWVFFALAAPPLLARCYERKGWVEVSAREIGDGEAWSEMTETERYDAAIKRHIEGPARR